MNGGYLMVSKADTKIYDKLQLGLKVGKPILWYESETVCYYIDTISGGEITSEIVDDEEVITYGDIILTKGGKTITVSFDGTDATVTEEGSIANPLMENIKDKNGNLRFAEGEITPVEIEGVTYTSAKWSLSGTHLMVVLAGNVVDATVLPTSVIASGVMPEYIYNKIYPVVNDVVLRSSQSFYATNYSVQSATLSLVKASDSKLDIFLNGITLTADRSFRFQFDLLIDAE